MFALALWDRNAATLFIARDRMGKKPLYYAYAPGGSMVFASEMRALAVVPEMRRRMAATAIDDFFAYGYVPDPATIYQDIHKLPAAHYMLLTRNEAAAPPRRYWNLPVTTHKLGERDAIGQLRAHLTAGVQKRLVADVPLGAFLSGGVDSGAVVATAASIRAEPLTTFTIGFEGAEDETPFARRIAERYGAVQYHERAAAVDMIDAARAQGCIFGEPFGDTSAVPTYRVCALARRHVTVALSGDGGDEVFAGYRRHRWHRLSEAVRSYVPAALRRTVIGQLAQIYPKLDRAPRWLRARHTLTELSMDSALGYFCTVARTHCERRRALFAPTLAAQLDGYDPSARVSNLMDDCGSDDPLLQAQYVDINTWLVGDILTKIDRASMANSLEVRAPFLDHHLVAWGIGLPARLKLRGSEGKYVLKRAMEPNVPRQILYRPKQGFTGSLADTLRHQAGRLRARLSGEVMAGCGLFSADAVARLIDEHEQGRFDHSTVLWLLLVFEGFLFSELAGGELPGDGSHAPYVRSVAGYRLGV